jgi:hypothetical protein
MAAKDHTLSWAEQGMLAAAAIAFMFGLVAAIFGGPSFWTNIKDYGSAIAGAWALAAGLLAVFATYRILFEQRSAATRARAEATHNLAKVVIAELEGLWDAAKTAEVEDKLVRSNAALETPNNFHPAKIHMRGEWLRTRDVNPSAFGIFPPPIPDDLVSLYTRLGSLFGRVKWMAEREWSPGERETVLRLQNEALSEVRSLHIQANNVVSTLKRLIETMTAK